MIAVSTMAKVNKLHDTLGPINEDVLLLRQHLQEFGAWPAAGDEYLALMTVSRWEPASITERDAEWLPAVVTAVHQGVDIGATYPSFFQKLLTNSSLRQQFVAALTAT